MTKKNANGRGEIEGGKIVDLSLVPDAQAGDWLLCHADLAINKIDTQEAQDILKLSSQCLHNIHNK